LHLLLLVLRVLVVVVVQARSMVLVLLQTLHPKVIHLLIRLHGQKLPVQVCLILGLLEGVRLMKLV
jgi:hypothetical protein